MKLLRKRWFAAVLMVLLVLAALFLGPVRSAYSARSSAKNAFFKQEDGFGDLNESFVAVGDYAKILQSLGKEYALDSMDEYKTAADTLKKAKMPAEKLYAVQKLHNLTDRFYAELAEKELDSVDADTAQRAKNRLEIETQRIEQIARVRKAGYNAAAEQYNTDVLDSPLTGWLLRLLGFEEIEKIY
ncbi:MAG: hypothetical protein II713_03055 [Clostridia bacterium]|nr:hypothetical protein [Clostridia bacterium]